MRLVRKIAVSLLVITLLISQLAMSTGDWRVSANGDLSLRVGVKDEIFTKSERMTFDVWAKDGTNQKIDDDFVTVTNNGKEVPINWSDTVKTSYTATLTEGLNQIVVIVDYNGQQLEKTIHVTYEYAKHGDIIGEFTFSMDGFVIGLDYFIEPIKVPIINGENAAIHLERVLVEHGFTPKRTGSTESSYYLASISGGNLLDKPYPPKIPQAIRDAEVSHGVAHVDETEYTPEKYGLGEFDFNYMSGWMYSVNNVFPNVGFSDYYLMDGDIMRVQFTVAYGSDIGGGYAMGNSDEEQLFPHVNKDLLTEMVATINSSPFKEALFAQSDLEKNYESALQTLAIVDVTQDVLEVAETNLRAVYESALIAAIIQTIDALPEDAMQSQRAFMEQIRYELDQLSASQMAQISNLSKFEALENLGDELVESNTPQHVQQVIDQIAALPPMTTLENGPAVEQLYTIYAALLPEEQALVTNAQLLLDAYNVYDGIKKVNIAQNLISKLPSLEDFKLEHEQQFKEAKAAFEQLSEELKKVVLNATTLIELDEKLTQLKGNDEQVKIQEVVRLIDSLPAENAVTLQHEVTILSVQNAYQQLTKEQQAKVTNSSKLNGVVAKMTQLKKQQQDQTAVKKVADAIAAIPASTQLTLSNKSYIQSVRAKYEALTLDQKVQVLSMEKLLLAELKIQELEAVVNALIAEINKLPVQITEQHEAIVQSLRSSFDALSVSQKMAVTNVSKLLEAEQKLLDIPHISVPKELREAVQTSEGIESVVNDEQAKTLTLLVDEKSTKSTVLSSLLIGKIQELPIDTVVVSNDNIHIELPVAIFSKDLANKASFEIDAKVENIGLAPTVKVDFAEVMANGIKRELNFSKQYVTVKLPLHLLSKATASTTSTQTLQNGVILRKTDKGYEAVPHKIVNGEAIIFANANAEYIYSTDTITFADIANSGDKENIEFLASRYVVKGYSAESFGPNKSITRAQFAVMIARALNLIAEEDSVHTDTHGKDYAQAIQALYEAGITDAKGAFNPTGTLTRQHAASYMYRVLKYTNYDFKENQKPIHLKDLNEISGTHLPAVLALYELGIMSGKVDGNFDPNGHLTRAQMAKILKLTLTQAGMM